MSPRLPGESRKERERAQNAGTWIAILMCVVVGGGMLGLMALVMPDILLAVIVVASGFLFIALHYFTWGQWLIRYHQRNSEQNDMSDLD